MHAKNQIPVLLSSAPLSLDSSVSIWLISSVAPHRLLVRLRDTILLLWHINTLLLARICSVVELILSPNGPISTGRNKLLSIIMSVAARRLRVVIRSATADGEHPEKTAADAERGCEPGGSEEGGVKGGLDAVGFGDGVEGADDDGGHDCCHDGGGNDCDC